jgi:hypothetical protein
LSNQTTMSSLLDDESLTVEMSPELAERLRENVVALAVDNADARFLLQCIDALPPQQTATVPFKLNRRLAKKVLKQTHQTFKERAGIKIAKMLATQGLLPRRSHLDYVMLLCKCIEMVEMGDNVYSDVLADTIGNALKTQLEHYFATGDTEEGEISDDDEEEAAPTVKRRKRGEEDDKVEEDEDEDEEDEDEDEEDEDEDDDEDEDEDEEDEEDDDEDEDEEDEDEEDESGDDNDFVEEDNEAYDSSEEYTEGS